MTSPVPSQSELAELEKWVDDVLAGQARSGASTCPDHSAIPTPPELADALVIIATKVTCATCGMSHVSSSRVMRRIPRAGGEVHYKAVLGAPSTDLPRIVEWAFETIGECWRCFDLPERLMEPTANLALAPDRVEIVESRDP